MLDEEKKEPSIHEKEIVSQTPTYVPITSNGPSRLSTSIYIVLHLLIVTMILFIVFHPVHWNPRFTTLYMGVITGSISGIAAAVAYKSTAQLKKMLLRRYAVVNPDGEVSARQREACATVIGSAAFKEEWRSWRVAFPLGFGAFVTASITSALTPSIALVNFTSVAKVFPNHDSGSCFVTQPNRKGLSYYSWQLPDSTYPAINLTAGVSCETSKTTRLFSSISNRSFKYAYPVAGVLVSKSAVGAPVSPEINTVPSRFGSSEHDPSFLHITHCFPAVVSNPVQCRAVKDATFNVSSNYLGIAYQGCNDTVPVKVNPAIEGASVISVCADEQKIGAATILFASVNSHAGSLAEAMQDTSFDPLLTSHDAANRSLISYVAKCTIDIAPSVAYKPMIYSWLPDGFDSDLMGLYSFHITANPNVSTCTPLSSTGSPIPLSSFLTPRALVTGASASMRLTAENNQINGLLTILLSKTSLYNPSKYPSRAPRDVYVFNNSVNALEDTLGVLSGLSLGMYWGNQDPSGEGVLEIGNGKGQKTGWRVGYGAKWTVICSIPFLACAIILAVAFRKLVSDGQM